MVDRLPGRLGRFNRPGALATKLWGMFGISNRLTCTRVQMGTKPGLKYGFKLASLAPPVADQIQKAAKPGLSPRPNFETKVFAPRADQSC